MHADPDARTQTQMLARGRRCSHADVDARTWTHVDARGHTQTHADARRRTQGKIRPVWGRTQPQDASGRKVILHMQRALQIISQQLDDLEIHSWARSNCNCVPNFMLLSSGNHTPGSTSLCTLCLHPPSYTLSKILHYFMAPTSARVFLLNKTKQLHTLSNFLVRKKNTVNRSWSQHVLGWKFLEPIGLHTCMSCLCVHPQTCRNFRNVPLSGYSAHICSKRI